MHRKPMEELLAKANCSLRHLQICLRDTAVLFCRATVTHKKFFASICFLSTSDIGLACMSTISAFRASSPLFSFDILNLSVLFFAPSPYVPKADAAKRQLELDLLSALYLHTLLQALQLKASLFISFAKLCGFYTEEACTDLKKRHMISKGIL